MKAIKEDFQPLLGELGVWVLTNYCQVQKDKGKLEKKKRGTVALDIIRSYLENGLDYLGQEKKYYFMNKYSPKKLPQERIARDSIPFIYSWLHYAPQQWYDH